MIHEEKLEDKSGRPHDYHLVEGHQKDLIRHSADVHGNIMCPIMSFIATLLFKNAGKEFVAVWLQTTFLNFPVAFFWQLIYCGPFIRFLFRKLFPEK